MIFLNIKPTFLVFLGRNNILCLILYERVDLETRVYSLNVLEKKVLLTSFDRQIITINKL